MKYTWKLIFIVILLSACSENLGNTQWNNTVTNEIQLVLTPTTRPEPTPTPTQKPHQIVSYESKKWKEYNARSTEGLAKGTVFDMTFDKDGMLWVATGNGVSKFDGENWHTLTRGDGLIDAVANSIAVDMDGIVWIGTDNGVSRFDGDSWQTYTTADGLAGNNVRTIAISRDGTVWVGAREYQDSFGFHSGGITSFDGDTWRTYTKDDGLKSNNIYALLFNKQDKLWAGTAAGLFSFNGQFWQPALDKDWHEYFGDIGVRVLAEAPDGAIWFRTETLKIVRYDGVNWDISFTYDASYILHPITICVDKNFHTWIGGWEHNEGSGQVLTMYDGTKWVVYENLPFRHVFKIIETQDGYIWLGTSSGVYRYNPN